ncbi:unnamed protein product [Rhizophagus irregularis]|nr:unnamed protein product [Rhizophagus irregularis]CAB4408425.1 unnamed protein product [Rhizophagus irregularis]
MPAERRKRKPKRNGSGVIARKIERAIRHNELKEQERKERERQVTPPPPYEVATRGGMIRWRCVHMVQYDRRNGCHGERPDSWCHVLREQAIRCNSRGFCSGLLDWVNYNS